MQSLRKFGGSSDIDEDDAEEAPSHHHAHASAAASAIPSRPFFLRDPQPHLAEVVAMAKANGEAAHLAVLSIDVRGVVWRILRLQHDFLFSQFFFFSLLKDCLILLTGSKNVHMATRQRGDIDKYGDERHKMAKIVTRAVYDQLDSMTPEARLRLLTFMAHTGLTATFELLQPDYLHVEVLLSSEPQLKFIAWTLPNGDGPGDSLTAMHPAAGLDVARHLGLTTVS